MALVLIAKLALNSTQSVQATENFQLCRDACSNLKNFSCKEWHSVTSSYKCEEVCGAYIQNDKLNNFSYYIKRFECVASAKSVYDFPICQVSCTQLDST